MAGIPWPTEPFYILSQVNDTDLVVGVNSENHAVLEPLTGTADQLWMATSDARGGARLTNPISGLALYARPADSTWVGAGPVDLSVPGGCWVLDDYPNASDGWMRIQCLPQSNNWWLLAQTPEQGTGLILAGWNGPNDQKEFNTMSETGEVTVTDIQYAMTSAASLAEPPVDFLAVTVDNTQASVALMTTITLSGSIQQSSQFQTSESDTEATAYTQSFSVKADLEIAEVTATATVEESQSQTSGYTSGTASTQTWEHDIQTQVTVPAGKKYSYQQRVNYGQVTVPYTAMGTFQSCVANTKPYIFPVTGSFTGLNATYAEILVADITTGPSPVVQTVPVSLLTSTASVPAP
jgi:hypothetical protein